MLERLAKSPKAHCDLLRVNKEPWHREFDKVKADKAVANHTFKTANVHV